MKKNLTLFLLFAFFIASNVLHAQTITSIESRCINTGKITINGTIGAGGPYQDSIVSGPSQYVNTGLHYTASLPDTFDALFPGTYSLKVIDRNGSIFTFPNVTVQGNYVLPGNSDYNPTTSAVTNCATPNGSIQGALTNGRAPYTYTILSGPAQVNTTNSTGTFSNLPAGSYQVQAYDSCQNIQTRNVTIANNIPSYTLSNPVVNRIDCNTYSLNAVTVSPSPTAGGHYEVWDYDASGSHVVAANGNALPLTFSVSKINDIQNGLVQVHYVDVCGNAYSIKPSTIANDWTFTDAAIATSCASGVTINSLTTSGTVTSPYTVTVTPTVGSTVKPAQTISSFPYTVTGVDASSNPLSLAISITDACGRTVSVTKNLGFSVSTTVAKFNNDCSTAQITVAPNGIYTSPITYTISPNPGIASNTTGNFTNIPDGSYTISATDACGKLTSFTQTINRSWKINTPNTESNHSCTIGGIDIDLFIPSKSIGNVVYKVYSGGRPVAAGATPVATQTYTLGNNGNVNAGSTDRAVNYGQHIYDFIEFADLQPGTYTVVAADACGMSDTASFTTATGHQQLTHSTTVTNKCINKGDIYGNVINDNHARVNVVLTNINTPGTVISTTNISQTSDGYTSATNVLLATNLPPGTYVANYSPYDCGTGAGFSVYDTVVVATYVQPQVNTIQSFVPCSGGNPVIVSASGGVAPYTYTLLGTTPDNYTSAAQTSPVFTLPSSETTGTVRVLDACLNSTTRTVAITKAAGPFITPNIASLSTCSLPLSFNLRIDSLYAGSVFSWTKITGTNAGSTVLSSRPFIPITYSSIADTGTYMITVTLPGTCYSVKSTYDVSNVAITCSPVISGNVFNDANGLTDNTVNGGGTNTGGLNAILVDGNNQVIATSAVASNGTYNFLNIPQGTYSVILSTTAGTVGSAAPSPSLPSGWVNTGENNGSSAGSDGTVNGILPNITVGSTSISNLNFGIEQMPSANNVSGAPQNNPGGTKKVTVPTLNGNDPEDGTYDGISNINTIVINTLPTNGTLYYNGTAVTAGQKITNYNPSLLQLDPNDGAITLTFTYSEIDAAGITSTPATVTMPFTLVSTLPIELISFNAASAGTIAKLNWQVSGQSNVQKFEIQRSTDNANTFVAIGNVNGNINSTSYSWIDASPSMGVNYYRLKMIDTYGMISYSDVKSARFDDAYSKGVKIYPVPANTIVQLQLPKAAEAGMSAQLFDNTGRFISNIPFNLRQTISISVGSLSTGAYTVKINKNGVPVYTGRLVKL